jgi:NADH-quinone oxidoreductase subunit J
MFILVVSSLLIFFSNNHVYSVLFLILSFVISAIILIMFEVEFIGLLFIMVYVGAVAVLFLFVVMMINVKKKSYQIKNPTIIYLNLIAGLFLWIKLYTTINATFFNSADNDAILYPFNYTLIQFDNLSNIEVIGQALYNGYNVAFILAGFILLVALIGSIHLTINFKESKKLDESYKQLSRRYTSVYKFK